MATFITLTGRSGLDDTKPVKLSIKTFMIDGILETQSYTTIYSARLGQFDVMESHDEILEKIKQHNDLLRSLTTVESD